MTSWYTPAPREIHHLPVLYGTYSRYSDDPSYVLEASEAGLAPGQWPATIEYEGTEWELELLNDGYATYGNERTQVRIYND